MDVRRCFFAWLLAGIAYMAVSMGISIVVQGLFSFDFTSLPGMRALDNPLFMLFYLSPWIYSLGIVLVYAYLGESLKGNLTERSITLGVLLWLVSILPSTAIVFGTMDYPIGFTVNQLMGGLLAMLAASYVTLYTYEKLIK
jgi:hypothetical protein